MPCYSAERKAVLLKKLPPPVNLLMAELVRRQEGISKVPLYAWRKQTKAKWRGRAGRHSMPTYAQEWLLELSLKGTIAKYLLARCLFRFYLSAIGHLSG